MRGSSQADEVRFNRRGNNDEHQCTTPRAWTLRWPPTAENRHGNIAAMPANERTPTTWAFRSPSLPQRPRKVHARDESASPTCRTSSVNQQQMEFSHSFRKTTPRKTTADAHTISFQQVTKRSTEVIKVHTIKDNTAKKNVLNLLLHPTTDGRKQKRKEGGNKKENKMIREKKANRKRGERKLRKEENEETRRERGKIWNGSICAENYAKKPDNERAQPQLSTRHISSYEGYGNKPQRQLKKKCTEALHILLRRPNGPYDVIQSVIHSFLQS